MKPAHFLSVLRKCTGKTAISFHSHADPDAVASAIALQPLVPHAVVRAIDDVDASAKNLLQNLGYGLKAFASPTHIHHFDNIVFVDVSSAQLLAGIADELPAYKGNVYIVDHHVHGKRIHAKASLLMRHRSSCAEVVLEIWNASGKRIPAPLASLLLAAVISDSAEFKSANEETFHAVVDLLSASKLSYEQARSLIATTVDPAKRMAVIKAVGAARVVQEGTYLIACTQTNAFELSCAQGLLDCGADVAVAANPGKGRLSAVKKNTVAAGNLSIGNIMEKVGKAYGGTGGGHENVGGARGQPGKTDDAVASFVRMVQRVLAKN